MTQKWLGIPLTVISLILMASSAWAETFHSPNGYSITAPRGWKFDKTGMMGADLFVFAKPQQRFANNLNVRFNPVPESITLQQVQAQIKATYPHMISGYKYISDKFTTINGMRAYELTYHNSQGTPPQQLWARQDMVIRGGKIYVFTCTALASNASHYESAFNGIINSVRLTGK